MDSATTPRTPASPQELPLKAAPATARWLPWVPYAVGALLLACGIFDLIEWRWVAAPRRQVHLFHVLFGITTTLTVVVLVSWLVHRASPPAVDIRVAVSSGVGEQITDEKLRNVGYARWFIQMRWIAVLVASLLLIFALHVAEILPLNAEWPLWCTVGALILCNTFYVYWAQRKEYVDYLLPVQVYLDLICLGILLHFSGGVENPLLFLTVFHVIIAGILLTREQCYAVAAAASLVVFAVAVSEWAHWVPHYTLKLFPHDWDQDSISYSTKYLWYAASAVASLTVTLLLVAHFVTTMADRARSDERLALEMATRATAERVLLERALATTGAELCVIDKQARYCWMSNRWKEWFCAEAAEGAVVPESARTATPAIQVLLDGKLRVTERMIHSSGENSEVRTLRITSAPLFDNKGEIAQVVELAQDVTQEKRVQAQLRQASKMAAVGGLAGNIVHEVNNPIGIISAKGRLLMSLHRDEMSKKVAEEVAKITDAADRVAGICRGLLSYCRPSMGHRVPVDVRLPLRKAAAMLEHRAPPAKFAINDRLPEKLSLVQANANELQQVFLNLLINALDAMPDGGKLTFSGHEENGLAENTRCVCVSIQDSGTGIPANILERIFDPFFTTKDDAYGTGLGLSICMAIIQSHGGTIEVESEPGHGTSVAIRLPCITSLPH